MSGRYIKLTKSGRDLIDEIRDHMKIVMKDCRNDSLATCWFMVGNVYIEIDYSNPTAILPSEFNSVSVIGVKKERDYPRIEEYIAHHLPDWYDVIDEHEKERREEDSFRDYLWQNFRW